MDNELMVEIIRSQQQTIKILHYEINRLHCEVKRLTDERKNLFTQFISFEKQEDDTNE